MEAGKSIMLAAQKAATKDEPSADDIYEIGCIANILQMLKLPDGTVKVLVEGAQRQLAHLLVHPIGHGEAADGAASAVDTAARTIKVDWDPEF